MRAAERLILALASVLAMSAVKADAAGRQTSLRHPVQVSNGRHLNLVCIGEGRPTVVFENGLGSSILDWKQVQASVGEFTRACVYDRGGKGYSDPALPHAHATTVVADLHDLVDHGHLARPMVLVGQSAGGLFATLYAQTYPGEVSGLVLVDPAFANQFRDWTARRPDERASTVAAVARSNARLAKCAALARAHELSVGDASGCTAFAGMSPRAAYTDEEKAYFAAQVLNPAYYDAVIAEQKAAIPLQGDTDRNSLDVIRSRRSFGSMPIVVLTSGMKGLNGSSATPEEEAAWKAFWKKGHDALAARSAKGESLSVPDAGHLIQMDRPKAVVDAVRRVVEAVRAGQGT
jgi:pimeloyl-ACP methyl ester carboxylesterase